MRGIVQLVWTRRFTAGRPVPDEDHRYQVTGTIELTEHVLTIGATARVTARICARIVTIRGSVTGSVTVREKVDIRATGSLDGDVIAPRIALVDGGYFHGTVTNSLRVSDHPSTGHSTRTA